jgi:hypothetical protein
MYEGAATASFLMIVALLLCFFGYVHSEVGIARKASSPSLMYLVGMLVLVPFWD